MAIKFLSGVNVDNNTLFVDDASNKVGIGTSSPSTPLHVNVAGASDVIRFTRDAGVNGGLNLDFGGANANFASEQGGYTFTTSSVSSAAVITSAGNVGIGTTSPTAKLTIDSGSTPQLLLRNPSGTNSQILLEDNSGGTQNASITFDQAGQNTLTIATGYQSTTDDNKIHLAPAGNIGLTVRGGTDSNNGNVGIGTTSPGAKLDIYGASPTTVYESQLRIYGSETTGNQDTGGAIAFSGHDGVAGRTFGFIRSMKENSTAGNYAGYMSFGTRANGSDLAEKMRITAAGNVGIGTTAPAGKLHVYGGRIVIDNTLANQSAIQFNHAGTEMAVLYRPSNISNQIRMYTSSGGDVMTWNQGNVGIGTTSPGAKLEVNGTLKATGEVTLSNYSNGGLSVDSIGVVKVEPSYQNISLGESYASNLREYYFRNGYTVSPTDTGYQYAKLIQQSLLNQASLVLVPQAQKNGLLAVNNPTGLDLTFTRSNDTATRVGPDGLIEKVRTNLLLQSNTFNTTWATASASATSGQAGYDGTNDAWLLDSTGGFIQQAIPLGGIYTFSVYAKKGSLDGIRLRVDAASDANCYINLNDGSEIIAHSGVALSVVSVGSGWYRIALTINDAAISNVRFYPINLSPSSATGNIYIQDAQMETGDIATAYIATTSAAVSVGPVANVPRLDYLNSSCPRLLLEPQRTNLLLFSEQFNNAAWSKTAAIVTANTAISPDGTQNADTLADNTGTSSHLTQQIVSVGATSIISASIYLKKNASRYAGVRLFVPNNGIDVGRFSIVVDLETGAITSTLTAGAALANLSYSVINAGNGWYRAIITGTCPIGTASLMAWTTPSGTPTNDGFATTAYSANGQSFYLWGAQFEVGAYATSYIPTLGAAVTRGADAASKTGISSLIGQTEGTLFVEFDNLQEVDVAEITLDDNTNSNRLTITRNITTAVWGIFSASAGTGGVNFGTTTGNSGKFALAYSSAGYVLYRNGVQIATRTAVLPVSLSAIRLNGRATNDLFANKNVSQALLFKTRLTNSQLAELTA